MRASLSRMPRLLGVLVLAFAPYERRPLLGAFGLLRGMAIQLAYRLPTGLVFADPSDRAVLLWSTPPGQAPRSVGRDLSGLLFATSVGMATVIVCDGMLVLPCGLVLWLAGVDIRVIGIVAFSIITGRLLVTLWRAVSAWRYNRDLSSRLAPPLGVRWGIDYLAAVPTRSGRGGQLLDEFLAYADKRDAEVVLHCGSRNHQFYRHHGFHVVYVEPRDGQRLMLRPAASSRRPGSRPVTNRQQAHQAPSPGRRRKERLVAPAKPRR